MPLCFPGGTIKVIRNGKPLRVEPGPQPFDFTEDEIATAVSAGFAMRRHEPVRPVEVTSAEPTTAKPRRGGRARPAADADDDDDGL